MLLSSNMYSIIHSDLNALGEEDGRIYTRLHDKRDYFDFPIVDFSCLWSRNIPVSLAYVFFCHSWYVMLEFVWNMMIFCADYLFWFQGYWVRDIYSSRKLIRLLTCRKLFGRHTDLHKCDTSVSNYVELWYMTGFQIVGINRDGCHIWDRKWSLFPEHLILLPLGS